MASASVLTAIENVQPPWSVNAFAQTAAMVALRDQEHLDHTLATLRQAKEDLVARLVARGMAPLPSAVHYFLLPVRSAGEAAARLLERHILVRDCTSFGLPTFIRIATQRKEDNAVLLKAFDALRNAQ